MVKTDVISVRKKSGRKFIKNTINQSLNHSIVDGGLYSVMTGFGEKFINPFAVAIGASAPQIGFLTSIPRLLASILQLLSAEIADKLKERKFLVTRFAFFQALTWALLLSVVLYFRNTWLLIFSFTLYVIFGAFGNAPWSSWMGDLIEEDRRGRFFGKRNMVINAVHLTSFVAAGVILNFFTQLNVFMGFAILFAVAFSSRLLSVHFLNLMYEPEYKVKKGAYFSLSSFVKKMAFNNFGRFVIFMSLVSLAVNFSGPFFAVYMLRDLNFSYLTYTIIIGSGFVSRVVFLRYWGRLCDKFGNRTIFGVTGFLIALPPLFWLFSQNVLFLAAMQIFAGFIWAGFNLSTGNYFFDAVTPQKRARCVAYYNFFNGIAIFVGASLGGLVAMRLVPWLFFVSKYQDLFMLSGSARFLIALAFIPLLKEVRLSKVPVEKHLVLKLVTIGPMREVASDIGRTMHYVDHMRKKVEDGFFFEVDKVVGEWKKFKKNHKKIIKKL